MECLLMSDRPTLYLSNWSSHRTPGCHGPGRKLTIMAAPRRWEHGAGDEAAAGRCHPAGRCHRAWVAPLLVAAGWRVVLDGEEVPHG